MGSNFLPTVMVNCWTGVYQGAQRMLAYLLLLQLSKCFPSLTSLTLTRCQGLTTQQVG
jgi:hypothetical protein